MSPLDTTPATPEPTPDNLHAPPALETVRAAIERAQRVLVQTQRKDGSWDEPSDIGPASTAQVLVALHFLGALAPDDLRDGARWLRYRQRPDGSYRPYPFAPRGDVGTTAVAWSALSLSRAPEDQAAAARARAWLDAHGGLDAVVAATRTGDVSAVFVALAGHLDPRRLPNPPMAFVLVPGAVDLITRKFHFGVVMGSLEMSLIARRLRGAYGRDGTRRGPIASRECARAVELLTIFQNADGSWNGNTVQTALALPALMAAGLTRDDPRLKRGIDWLLSRRVRDEHGLHLDVFASDVWSTAFSVRALLSTGVPRDDARITAGVDWLLSRQLTVPQPAVNNRNPGAPRTGGWPFQTGNETMADADDVGIVLSVLGQALYPTAGEAALPADLAARVRASVATARAWLGGMQNPDGGWSAFVWGLPGKTPGPIMTRPLELSPDNLIQMARAFFHPPVELGDPSTEDLTGRVLHGLGRNGERADSPAVARALAFLRTQQCEWGAWWGRWVVNYVASTAYVLAALAEVGEDLSEAYVQRALRWLLARQNPDGGWGESVESYREPARAGRGPSTAPLTALVISALVDVGLGDSPECARAVRYLLGKQRPDGTFPNDDYLATNIPPDGFYFYAGAARHMPLEALGRYAQRHARAALVVPAGGAGRWTSAVLGPMRLKADPIADAVVARVFAEGEVAAVNALLARIFRNDDPIPPELPDYVEAYFAQTEALPDWVDPARVARAERLFARYGAQITFGLFCSSLPQAYGAAHGAAVLVQTQAMTQRVRQRIFETAQFLFDAVDVGALAPGGRGIRSAQRVRLMHAAVRRLILARDNPAWDQGTLGLPINQEDMAGTLMTFSAVTFDAIRRLGGDVSPADGDAWIHAWNVVGHFLGIDPSLLPRDLADAEELMEAIRQRQWMPSPEGRKLAAALVAMMQEFFTHGLLDGLTPTLVRHLAGDQCADLLDIARPDWTRAVVRFATDAAHLFDEGQREAWMGRAFGEAVRVAMQAVIAVEREGKRASFRIPDSLRRTVIPGT